MKNTEEKISLSDTRKKKNRQIPGTRPALDLK